MYKNSENYDTPLPDALHENYSTFLYGDSDQKKDYHNRISNQYFQYPENSFKNNRITDSFSPLNTNFLSMNIWNESPLNILRNFEQDNANDHFDDVNVYQMFKEESMSNNNNKATNKIIPKKNVSRYHSVAIKLDFNECEVSQKQQRYEVKQKITKKAEISKPYIQQTVKYVQNNKITKELSESSKKSKETIIDNSQNSNKRNSKGLRNLSETVREIVQEAKVTTYKQVADKLINKLDLENKISLDPNSKDQQNVKRRVYDALNVLISAEILRKQGKNVMSESNKIKKGKTQIYQQQIYKLKNKIELTKTNVLAKYEKMENLRKKYDSISNLIARNKEFQKSIKQKSNLRRIRFPFIGLIFKSNFLDHKSTLTKKYLNLRFASPFTMVGDIDTLLKLNIKLNSQRSKLPKQIMDYKYQIQKQQQEENQVKQQQ